MWPDVCTNTSILACGNSLYTALYYYNHYLTSQNTCHSKSWKWSITLANCDQFLALLASSSKFVLRLVSCFSQSLLVVIYTIGRLYHPSGLQMHKKFLTSFIVFSSFAIIRRTFDNFDHNTSTCCCLVTASCWKLLTSYKLCNYNQLSQRFTQQKSLAIEHNRISRHSCS